MKGEETSRQQLEKTAWIQVVAENVLSSVALAEEVIDGVLIFHSKLSRPGMAASG